MNPKILLSMSASCTTVANYLNAVEACDATPVSGYLPEYESSFDGLIICGGQDTDPSFYGEDFQGAVDCDPKQDAHELELIRLFLEAGKPVFGICRGYQIMNIYFGGTLHQHLENTSQHKNAEGKDAAHFVTADANSVVGRLYGQHFSVNSVHHQAIKRLGNGLRITAKCEDVIEAIEHTQLPVLGVQWHPERLSLSQHRDDCVDGMPLLQHFVDLCRTNINKEA